MAGSAAAQDKLPYMQTIDLVYGQVHGTGLLMDVFTPRGAKNGLALVDIASGGWFSHRGIIREHKAAKIYDIFCARGYTVFAVRPGSQSRYDAAEMVRHVKRGIRYVKEHAAEYGIDPERLALMGASAGGHLACLAAVTAEDGKPEAKDPLERHDTRIKAVGAFFPPTDFLNSGGRKRNLARMGTLLFAGGVQDRSEEEIENRAIAISPARQVSGSVPPFLLIHGDADPVVPLQQSQRMIEALKAAGASAELIVKTGGGHAWRTISEEVAAMADWMDKQLKD
jgi:acetyl esterase/lipase